MLSDSTIRSSFETMMGAIDAPQVSMHAIARKIAQPAPAARRPRFLYPAVAAAAIAIATASLPFAFPGLVRAVEAQIEAIIGWTPPHVPPPAWLMAKLGATPATLESARARVPFALVTPAGLPPDANAGSISIARAGVYTKATQTWSVGTPYVTFTYRRSHGRTFSLLVDAYDPQTGPPGKYMFEDEGNGLDGQERLVRHRSFKWRNGDQVTSATASDSISAAEIEAIQKAMNGTPIAPAETRAQRDSGTIDKLYAL